MSKADATQLAWPTGAEHYSRRFSIWTDSYAKVQRVQEKEKLMELVTSCEDVLSDKLKREPMNTHEPMKIHLMRGGGEPYRTAISFEEQADKILDELKSMGVITEVNEPTAWCSSAFWVPKPDNLRVQLVKYFKPVSKHD